MIDFGLKDAIDIALVALLLTYLYRVMRKSSAANIFTGVLTFVVIWIFVSKVFEMRLLGSLFDALINMGALALIILFQEEIRQFFSTLGTQRAANWLRWMRRNSDDVHHREEIMPLVMACMSMSKQKVGALIVVERETSVTDLATNGETLDAAISQRLIENIFFKNSPLHDGAMVIGNKRVRSAGNILPVAHDSNIPKSLGLRHRAALGLSQKSDALIIIVSEETGNISIAQDGQLFLKLSAEDLESRLTATLGLESA
ncbi:MAG: diadenylate cyclase CdaA [Bacteroidales bacterium]|nr:diadenylate cyclase CdaA [Bacteroidales bacterium]